MSTDFRCRLPSRIGGSRCGFDEVPSNQKAFDPAAGIGRPKAPPSDGVDSAPGRWQRGNAG
jgi:hypothetical protein